jgi:hypothetical protein
LSGTQKGRTYRCAKKEQAKQIAVFRGSILTVSYSLLKRDPNPDDAARGENDEEFGKKSYHPGEEPVQQRNFDFDERAPGEHRQIFDTGRQTEMASTNSRNRRQVPFANQTHPLNGPD